MPALNPAEPIAALKVETPIAKAADLEVSGKAHVSAIAPRAR